MTASTAINVMVYYKAFMLACHYNPAMFTHSRKKKYGVCFFVCVCVLLYVTAATVFYLGSSTSVTKCYVNDTDVKLEPTKVLTN